MNIAIFPGSFDVFHEGHLFVLRKALNFFDQIIILVSNNPNKIHKSTLKQRCNNIETILKNNNIIKNVVVSGNSGLTAQYCHNHKIKFIIRGIRDYSDIIYESDLAQKYHKVNSNLKFIYIYADNKHKYIRSSLILSNR